MRLADPSEAEVTETQTLFTVAEADAGIWQAHISGDTEGTTFALFFLANDPPPSLAAGPSITPDGEGAAEVQWRLFSALPETAVTIYANPDGQITHTMTITGPQGQLESITVHICTGIQLARIVTSTGDGSDQRLWLDLRTLPSGNYWFWIEAADGVHAPVRLPLASSDSLFINVDNSVHFPSSWTPALATHFDSERQELQVAWPAHTHPDVTGYIVRVQSTDPLSPTETLEQQFQIAQNTAGGQALATVPDIALGQPYTVAVGLQRRTSDDLLWSAPLSLVAPQPDFIISRNGQKLKVQAGGAMLVVPLTVDLASDLPDPVAVAIDWERLPVGLEVQISEPLVQAATAAQTVTAKVIASASLPAGSYVLPIVGRSGPVQHRLEVTIEVLPAATIPGPDPDPTFGNVCLPLIQQ